MKSILDYILESKEDGKYIDLPITQLYKFSNRVWSYSKPKAPSKTRRKPNYGPGSRWKEVEKPEKQYQEEYERYLSHLEDWKSRKNAEEKAWNEHVKLVKEINEENFDILIDKMLKLLKEEDRRQDFIKSQVASLIDEKTRNVSYGKNTLHDLVIRINNCVSTDDKTLVKYWFNNWTQPIEESMYNAFVAVARLYQIDVPNFSSLAPESTVVNSVQSKIDGERDEQHHRKISDAKYDKLHQRMKKEYEKDKEKAKKMREKFRKSEIFKQIEEIIEIFEDDVEQIFRSAEIAYTRYAELAGKNKAFEEAKQKMINKANNIIEKTFHFKAGISCFGPSLVDILATAYLSGDEDPEVEVIDKKTSSWLSGMKTSCKFKIITKDDKELISGKYEDAGLGNTPGFGPWD